MTTFHDDGISNFSGNLQFDEVLAASQRRREFLKGTLAAATATVVGLPLLSARSYAQTPAYSVTPRVGFEPIPASEADSLIVPEGYRAEVLMAWGDPLSDVSRYFRYDASNSAEDQEQQWGMHNDGMHFFLRGIRALQHRRTGHALVQARPAGLQP